MEKTNVAIPTTHYLLGIDRMSPVLVLQSLGLNHHVVSILRDACIWSPVIIIPVD